MYTTGHHSNSPGVAEGTAEKKITIINIHISYGVDHLGRSKDLDQNIYTNSTCQDKQNGTRIRFTAPFKLKLLSTKINSLIWEKSALL